MTMTLDNLDSFSDAAPLMSHAFFGHDQPAFVTAVQGAKDALSGYPSLLNKLNQAVALFPAPQALELVLEAIADVIEMHRQEIRHQALQRSQTWPYLSDLK